MTRLKITIDISKTVQGISPFPFQISTTICIEERCVEFSDFQRTMKPLAELRTKKFKITGASLKNNRVEKMPSFIASCSAFLIENNFSYRVRVTTSRAHVSENKIEFTTFFHSLIAALSYHGFSKKIWREKIKWQSLLLQQTILLRRKAKKILHKLRKLVCGQAEWKAVVFGRRIVAIFTSHRV